MTKRRLALTVAGVTGVAALAFGVPALAGEPATSTPSATATEHRAKRDAEFAERLAQKLGLDRKRVEDAVAEVREEMRAEAKADRLARLEDRLDRAVEDGRLTRAEADAVLKAAEKGVLPAGRLWHPHRDRHGPPDPTPRPS